MSRIFAIRSPRQFDGAATTSEPAKAPDAGARADSPLEALLKLIPGEAVTFFGIGMTTLANYKARFTPQGYFFATVLVTVVGLLMVVVIRSFTTDDPTTHRPQVLAIVISCISFLIYTYAMGGMFRAFPGLVAPGWISEFGLLAAIVWTTFTPFIFMAVDRWISSRTNVG